MKRSKFTEAQIAFALRQSETGTRVDEICRQMGVSQATFFNWKKKYGGLGVPELRKLRQLEEENAQLKKLVADLSLEFKLFEYLSDKLFYKYVMLFNNSSLDPESKIKALIIYYKQCAMKEALNSYHLPFTRQQIAKLTGLRVETVIRTIKRMADQGVLHVENRKIYC